MAPVTILLPNNISGIVARRHLAAGLEGRGNGVAGLYLSTLPRLAEQLAGATLHPRRPASSALVAAAWRAAVDEAPGCFENVKDHPATIRALASSHRELRDLSAEGRDRVRHSTTLSPDLLRLHESVVARLSVEWYDETDLLHAARDLVDEHPERLTEQGEIILYLPQSLTRAEAGLAQALAGRGLTVIAGLTGVRRADHAVRRTLGRLGLEDQQQASRPPVASTVLHASDSDDEVRCVVRQVATALASGVPAHRVAVLYGSPLPYARLLHEHLAAAGLAVNGPATRSVHERAVARGLLAVLQLARTGTQRGSVFSAISEAPTRDLAGGPARVTTWERVSRAAGIVGGGDWIPKLQRYSAGQLAVIEAEQATAVPHASRIEAAQREMEAADDLAAFIDRLVSRLDEGSSSASWIDLSSWTLSLFHDLYGSAEDLAKLPPEEQYAAVVVESTLSNLSGLAAFEPVARLSTLMDVLANDLESALPRVGRFGEGVFVGPVSAAVGLDLDDVFIVGLAEDGFPGRLHEDALLNDVLREAADGELQRGRDQLDAKQRHLLAAFSGATRVTASFPRGDLRRSTRRLPSRFLLHSLRGLTGNPLLSATEWDNPAVYATSVAGRLVGSQSFADSLRTTDAPISEQEWRSQASSAGKELADAVVDAARTMGSARSGREFTRFDGNLAGVEGLPDYADGVRVISPTALESFASCPQKFFAERLLHVKPLEDPEEIIQISAADRGTFIHEAMDELVQEAHRSRTLPTYGAPWTSDHHVRLREIALAKAEAFSAQGVTGHHRLWQAELVGLLAALDAMLHDDDTWRAGRDAEVVGSELTFGMGGKSAVRIPVGDREMLMRGSADKIDRTRDGTLLVTDIKSGRADKFKVLADDPVAAGTKLQLPVYAHAARREHSATRVEAQYWFVLRDAGRRIPVLLDEDLEATYAKTLSTLVTGISEGSFIGKPSESPGWGYIDCHYCTPDGLGHEEARERYLRKRSALPLESLMTLIDPDALTPDVTELDS